MKPNKNYFCGGKENKILLPAEQKIVKPNCGNCLNKGGYSWDCDREPREFEPEYKLVDVPGEKNTVTSDFSNIPKDRKIYCREFIPEGDKKTTPHWSQCNYVNNKWYKKG